MTSPSLLQPNPRLRTFWGIVRLATASALFAAIVKQIIATTEDALGAGQHLPTALANHLSYFTVLSTAAGAIVLAIGGVWLVSKGRTGTVEPRWMSVLFLCIGAAVVITGIVFNLLLRNDGVPDPDTLTWASDIKHVVAPIVFALDLILHIGRAPFKWSDAALALIYPVLWAVYTLVRGELITDPVTGNPWWYPYGFLDPHRVAGGYAGVAAYVVGIALALALLAAGSVWISRRRGAGSPATGTEHSAEVGAHLPGQDTRQRATP